MPDTHPRQAHQGQLVRLEQHGDGLIPIEPGEADVWRYTACKGSDDLLHLASACGLRGMSRAQSPT